MTESMFSGLELDFGQRLEVIKTIASCLPPVPESGSADELDELATLLVANSGYKVLNRELDLLITDMGVDVDSESAPFAKLAEVIQLFDGGMDS